jgi:hypothetical protein
MLQSHVDHLFSSAYDDQLSEHEAQRFQEHIRGCEACSSAYEAFRTSLDAVRALPQARMPVAVHLPSTAPVAEQRPFARIRIPRLRFGAGGATAIAAAAAAVIVAVALLRPGATPNTGTSLQSGGDFGGASTVQGGQCPTPVQATSVTGAPPAGYNYRSNASDPHRPGQQLVLATSTSEAAPGSDVIVYAQLTVPLVAAAVPGSAGGTQTGAGTAAVVPCLTLSGLGNGSFSPLALAPGGANHPAPSSAVAGEAAPYSNTASSALFTFTIPPGTPPGTVLYVVATIPPGYPHAGDPPLTVNLQITVR